MIRRLAAIVFVLLLGATACASGGDGTESVATAGEASDSQGSPDSEAESDAAPVPTPDPDEPSMAASSPIGAFFADDGGFEAAIAEYTIRVEEAIVICMAEQGFEFKSTGGARNNEVQELQSDMTIRAWTTEFGYGISTSFDSVAQGQASDPNAEIIFSLSAAEREVWVETLTGFGFAGPPESEEDPPMEEQGCIGAALISTGGQDAIEGLETFGEAYEEGEEAIFDQREMVDAVDAWSRCLSERGYPGFSDRDAPQESIRDEFDTVISPMSDAIDELTPEEGQALISGESLDLADLPGLDLDSLRELQLKEIELATADLDCYEIEVKAIYEPLRDDFERGLMGTFGSELDALKNIGS